MTAAGAAAAGAAEASRAAATAEAVAAARAGTAAGGGGGQGGYGGGRGGGRDGRYGGGGGGGRGDVEQHDRDGSFRSSVRIIGLEQLQDALKNQEQAQPAESGETPPEGEGSGGTGGGPENLARSSS